MLEILKLLLSVISPQSTPPSQQSKKPTDVPPSPTPPSQPSPTPTKSDAIDWSNPACHISEHFTVKDALWLNEWSRLATEADGLNDEIKANILKTAKWMETVRAIVGKPIFVKSWFRPKAYNLAIGGATFSQHMVGNAVDWWTDVNGDGEKNGEDCDLLKAMLMPRIESLGLRMEDNGKGARWVHLDDKPVPAGGSRFFKP